MSNHSFNGCLQSQDSSHLYCLLESATHRGKGKQSLIIDYVIVKWSIPMSEVLSDLRDPLDTSRSITLVFLGGFPVKNNVTKLIFTPI